MKSSHGECPQCTSDQWTFCKTSHRRKDDRSVLRCTRCWLELTVTIGEIKYVGEDYSLTAYDGKGCCTLVAIPPEECEWVSSKAGHYGTISVVRGSSSPGFPAPKTWMPPVDELMSEVRKAVSEGYFVVTKDDDQEEVNDG